MINITMKFHRVREIGEKHSHLKRGKDEIKKGTISNILREFSEAAFEHCVP